MPNDTHTTPIAQPGTSLSRLLALLSAFILGGLVIIAQNAMPVAQVFEKGQTLAQQSETAGETVPPPQITDPFTMAAEIAVKLQSDPTFADDPDEVMVTIDRWATTPESRVRAAIVAGEVIGPDEALDRLAELNEALPEGALLRADVADLRTVYELGPGLLSEDSADRLATHHGYFGRLALVYGMDDDDPVRAELFAGGGGFILLILVLFVVFGMIALLGFCMFITAIVMLCLGKLRSGLGPVAPGGSVFLETFAVFAGGFLLLKVGTAAAALVTQDETALTVIGLLAQWMLLVTPLWPLIRGMAWRDYRLAIGLHSGRGVLREIGAGVLGYLAGLPLLALGMGVAFVLVTLVAVFRQAAGLGDPPPPSTEIFQLIGSDNILVLLGIFLLAVVWAPLCEETIFRGALYRHMRGRAGVVISALASALIFGLFHAYGPVLVMPVVMLGTTFAFMREWRGSLIAPITAHAMHNATVTITLYIVLKTIS